MENSYGIGVANRYELFLNDESDPLDTLTLKEQELELKKKTKVAEKENKGKTDQAKAKNNQKKPVKEAINHKTQDIKRDGDSKSNFPRSNADGKPERTFNKFNNENNREERNNRKNREDRPYSGPSENRINKIRGDREDRPRRDNGSGDNTNNDNRNRERGPRSGTGGDMASGNIGGSGNGDGRREGRGLANKQSGGPRGGSGGPRRNNNFDERRGKREFDRQSGSDKTGVKPVEKREGGGAHNWGSYKDVIEEADQSTTTNENEPTWGENEAKVDNVQTEAKDEGETEGAPTEEEPKELTLDEWKAQRAGRAKPQYNIRKAGEGEDPSQWKKMYVLRKKENDEESEEEEYDVSEYPQRVGRQKHLLDIDIQFNDNRRPGGGRGGRGQRSGPRGNRANPRNATERPERRFRNVEEQNDERNENRRAPKVDDERDFPSLG